jgi:hypothetical protein
MDVRFRNGGDTVSRGAINAFYPFASLRASSEPRRRRGPQRMQGAKLGAEVLDDAVADGCEGFDQCWFFFFEECYAEALKL